MSPRVYSTPALRPCECVCRSRGGRGRGSGRGAGRRVLGGVGALEVGRRVLYVGADAAVPVVRRGATPRRAVLGAGRVAASVVVVVTHTSPARVS